MVMPRALRVNTKPHSEFGAGWGWNSVLLPVKLNPVKNQRVCSRILSPEVGVGFLFHKCNEKDIIATERLVGLRGIPF